MEVLESALSSRYLPYVLTPLGIYAASRLLAAAIPGPQHHAKLDFKDKTVLIIGASTGLGRALAFEAYRKGARVIVTARSLDKLKQLCEELVASYQGNPHEPVYRYLDVADPTDVEDLRTLAIDGRTIHVLINNAGLSMRGAIDDTPLSVHRQVMEVNFFGQVAVTRALLSAIPDDGCIIVTSSMQGRIAVPWRSAYSASKHALQGFFDTLRGEHRPSLHILVVSAGYINTGFGSRALTVEGRPTGKQDENQLKGYSPDEAAREILTAAENRKTELVMAPLMHRVAIFLRWFCPNLFFYIMYKRGQKEEYARKKKTN